MEITIQINGQAVSVEVSYEVYEYLCESDRKDENLAHEQRRHKPQGSLEAGYSESLTSTLSPTSAAAVTYLPPNKSPAARKPLPRLWRC